MSLTALTLQAQRKFTVNITPDGKANMVCYLPAQPTGRAIVDLPGGGYTHLATQHEGHDWATWFNDQGIAFFVVTYRMPGGDRTIPMGDAQQAIRTVRDSAKVWQINPYDVGIMGFSAGGHLASTVSTHSELDCRPNFSILFYPVISMNERETHSGSVNGFLGKDKGNKELVKQFSNQNAVRVHETPPAIILLANDDRAVPPVTNGIAYYSAMRRAGNECALHVYPTGGHGFGFRPAYKFHDQMLGDLKTWLDAHKSPKADAVRVACIGNSITEGMGIELAPQRGRTTVSAPVRCSRMATFPTSASVPGAMPRLSMPTSSSSNSAPTMPRNTTGTSTVRSLPPTCRPWSTPCVRWCPYSTSGAVRRRSCAVPTVRVSSSARPSVRLRTSGASPTASS